MINKPDATSISLSSSAAIIVLFASFLFLSILNGFLFDLLGAGINEWLVLALVLAQLAALIVIIHRSGSVQIERRWDELVGFILLLIGISAYLIYPSLPTLLPPSHHYDAVHPIVLADYIFDNRALPHDFSGNSKPYYPGGYPIGGALVVALISHWLGRVPMQTLHPFISFIVALTAGLTFCFICRILPRKRTVVGVALIATLLLFTAWDYFAGAVNERYFFAQTFAQLFALLTFFYLVNYFANPGLLSIFSALSGLAAVLFIHPSPMVAPTLGTLSVIFLRLGKDHRRLLTHLVVLGLGLGSIAVFYVLPRLGAWIGQTGYGEAAPLGAETIGFVLPTLGLLGIFLVWWEKEFERYAIPLLLLFCVLVQPFLLIVGSLFLNGIGIYYLEKSIYMLIYPLSILCSALLLALSARLERRLGVTAVSVVVWGMAFFLIPVMVFAFPPRPFAPLTESELQAAEWAKTHISIDDLAVVSPIREDDYWVRVAVFEERPDKRASISAYNLGSLTYEEWRGNPVSPNYAIVRNRSRVPNDSAVESIYQVGTSAILFKPPLERPPSWSPRHPSKYRFGEMFDLLGYDVSDTWAIGLPISITLYWRPLRWPTDRVSIFLQIVNPSGEVVARREDEMFQNKFLTQRWPIGITTPDEWTIPLPQDIDPGEYAMEIAVFDKVSGARMPVSSGSLTDDAIRLGPFPATNPPPSQDELLASQSVNARFGGAILLRGFVISGPAFHSGDSMTLRLYWQSIAAVTENYFVFVHLIDQNNRILTQRDAEPQNGTSPTSTWVRDQVVADRYRLTIPKATPPGEYRIRVGLYSRPDLRRATVTWGSSEDDSIVLPMIVQVR